MHKTGQQIEREFKNKITRKETQLNLEYDKIIRTAEAEIGDRLRQERNDKLIKYIALQKRSKEKALQLVDNQVHTVVKWYKIKAIGKKRRDRIDKWWDEPSVFKRVKARWYCDLTGVRIHEPRSRCFAHILAKWMYPTLRLLESNIIYVANRRLHTIVDELAIWHKSELYHKVLDWTAISFIKELFDAYYATLTHPEQEELKVCF